MRLFHKIVLVLTLAFAVPTVMVGFAASHGMQSIERHAAETATSSLRRSELQQLDRLASERAHAVEAMLAPLAEDVELLRTGWEDRTTDGRNTDAKAYAEPGLPDFPGYGRVDPKTGAYADFDRLSSGSPWMPRFAVEAARRDPATRRRLAAELDRLMLLTPMLHGITTRHADLVDLGWIVLVDGPANVHPPYDYPALLARNPGIADVVEAEEDYVRMVGPVENPERATRWLEPYFDAFKGLWMTSCVAPLYQGDVFLGAVGLDILLSTVTREVLAPSEDAATQPFLLASNERLLAVAPAALDALALDETHRSALRRTLLPADRQEWPVEELESLKRTLDEHPSPEVRALAAAMQTGERVSRQISLGDRDVFVSTSPVASTGWSLAVVRPTAVALAGVEAVRGTIREHGTTVRHQFLIFAILVLAIGGGVGTFLNFVAVRPLGAFIRQLELLKYDKLEFTDELARRQDEIGQLNHKFAELVGLIRSARDELTAARDTMQHQVEERTAQLKERDAMVAQLEAARAELMEAAHHKDQFLAMLGHELRNPLFAIRTAVRLLAHGGATDPQQMEALQGVLDRQSSHMTRLVEGLLDVSRIARGKLLLDCRRMDVAEVLRRVTQDRAPEIAARGIVLQSDVEPSLWVDGDEVRLTQVFANLLGNALKFTPVGGRVWVEARGEGDQVVARVRDTGLGMDAQTKAHLFEPFRQGPQDLARTEGGLGLGLALAKGLVELHHGTLEASSPGVGQGSEFVVRLGRCPAPVLAPTEGVHAVSVRRRVLVVEDQEDAADMLARALLNAGHEVSVARSGPEAVDRVRRDHPDVVLCDIGLPGMSGHEVARAIRADHALDDVLLLALTGYGQAEDVARSREAGFDLQLTKPIDLEAIESAFSARAA